MSESEIPVPAEANTAASADGADLVDETLIEEVSIDGMCGVY